MTIQRIPKHYLTYLIIYELFKNSILGKNYLPIYELLKNSTLGKNYLPIYELLKFKFWQKLPYLLITKI